MASSTKDSGGRPSEEILNAFVDGEFSAEDRLETLMAIASSERISREVCDMHQLKELVNMAYRDAEPPQRRCGRLGQRRMPWVSPLLAGVLAVAAGAFAGLELTRNGEFLAGPPGPEQTPPEVQSPGINGAVPGGVPGGVVASHPDRVLLHLNEEGAAPVAELLDDIEAMYREAEATGQDLAVQVVVHSQAMELLRADRAPYPGRVAEMKREFSGLRFTACEQSLERLAREEGVDHIPLLPQAETVPSGVVEAARRQAQGWIYIKV